MMRLLQEKDWMRASKRVEVTERISLYPQSSNLMAAERCAEQLNLVSLMNEWLGKIQFDHFSKDCIYFIKKYSSNGRMKNT